MDRTRTKLGLAFGAVALAGVALGFTISARLDVTGKAAAAGPPVAGVTPAAPASATPQPAVVNPQTGTAVSFVKLAKDVGPAVVHIRVSGRQSGQGTGFIISSDGFILTNDHVVGDARDINVTLADDREFQAKVVGTDPKTDIALIKIDDSNPLPTAPLGDSDVLEIGEWVIAIGNPFGLDHTVTAGIVSAKERRDVNPGGRNGYYDFIQTDASINPGNSGGPLINAAGQVVGINSAIYGQGTGIGFAIPINMAKTLIPILKQHGQVARSWLGVTIQPVSKDLAKSLGLASTNGAMVADVVPGSPAESAGIRQGDVITTFDGKPIKKSSDLPWIASTAGIGRTVDVTVEGSGGPRTVKITLEEMPNDQLIAGRRKNGRQGAPGAPPQGGAPAAALGLEVETVTPDLARRLNLDEPRGAVVVNIDRNSPATGNLVPGDVVVEVNGARVADAADFARATQSIRSGDVVKLLLYRNGAPMWLAFTVP